MCLQSERALADEQAQQMAMQAHMLLQEKADMAVRLAAQEHQDRKLLLKLYSDTPELGLHPSEKHS